MKKLCAFLLVAAMLLCAATAFAAVEPLRLTWWGSESSNALYLSVSDMFQEATGIEYEAEYLSWDDYWTKLNTLAAANDLPDCLRMDLQYIKSYVDKGLLMDLTELVEKGLIDLSDVPESAISGGMSNGGLYGINAGSNSLGILYNAKMIEDAGMQVPTNELTWEEFEQFVIELHEKSGKFGTDLWGMRDFNGTFRVYARAHGEALYNKEQTAPGFSVETLAAYLSSVKRMHDAGAVQNVSEITVDVGRENQPFSKGEAASITTTTDSSTTYYNMIKEAWGPAVLRIIPGAAQNKAMWIKPSQFLSISKDAENVEEAAAYINYWCNDEAANRFINGRRGVPISEKMAGIVGGELEDASKMTFDYMIELAQYASDLYDPDPTAHSEIDGEFITTFQSVLFGEMTPEQGAQHVYDFIAKALND